MNKKYKNRNNKISKIVIVIIIIFLIILALGWFFKKEKEKVIIEDKEKKQVRLKEVEERINFLIALKERIAQKKKIILISARTLIGIILIISNFFYKYYFLCSFDLGKMLNFNGAVLLCYSFLAFITYGTIYNFISAMKLKLTYVLEKNHIPSLEELELLKKERNALSEEIKNLNNDLENINK